MNKRYNNGFSIVSVITVIAILAVLGGAGYTVAMRQNNADSVSTTRQPNVSKSEDDLVLQNLGLESFSSIYISNEALREYKTNGLKGFYPFGDTLANTGRQNPTLEFSSLKSGAKVIAAIDGTVVFVKQQAESSDNEVFLQTHEGSQWIIGYDHLTNVQVKRGDTVKAGDVLGEPALQGNGLPRFEIQVNKKGQNNSELSYCPVELLAESVREATVESLRSMMQQWENVSSLELYDIDNQNPPGCLAKTVKP